MLTSANSERVVFRSEYLGVYRFKSIVRDPIYKQILINVEEYNVIQHPLFRRLHNIKQTGLAYLVYPSAKHTRFEHSLGVMRNAGIIAKRIIEYLIALPDINLIKDPDVSIQDWSKYFIQLARFAGLLHDLGHLPYSHTTEAALKDIIRERKDTLSKRDIEYISVASRRGLKIHEYITSILIEKLYEENRFERIKDYLNLVKSIMSIGTSKYLEFIKICENEHVENSLRNIHLTCNALKLAKDIISSSIVDADRLDYLVRDAYATGTVYGNIDVDRIIYSIRPIKSLDRDTGKEYIEIAYDIRGLSALEDLFDARYKMYRWVYLHHKKIAFEEAFKRALLEIYDNWDKIINNTIYSSYCKSFFDLFNPKTIYELAKKGIYVDDSLIDELIRVSMIKLNSRWAKALLKDRNLLPISVIKRSEDLYIHLSEKYENILNMLEAYIMDKRYEEFEKVFKETLRRLDRTIDERLIDGIRLILHSEVIEKRDANIYTLIFSDGRKLNATDVSQYIQNLKDIASSPVIYIYVYSEDENSHKELLRAKTFLRDALFETLRKISIEL